MNPADPSPIPLVAQLTDALADAGVLYCHWKSNAGIQQVEQGETDLDLLIARDQARLFTQVVTSAGFVPADRPRALRLPGVTNFFGYDSTVDRFVHIHAHYRLVLGHDRSKNYHLPIEVPFLASVSRPRVLPVPSPEFEYLVFVIRMVLKYAVVDEILWMGARGRRPAPKRSERDEYEQLRKLIDSDEVDLLREDHLPFVSRQLFADAEQVAMGDAAVWRTVAVARRMRAALAANTRSAQPAVVAQRFWRRLALLVRRRLRRPSGYRLASGGVLIAVMGGDGAGKSTALEEIGDWLERHFDVMRIHLGKPPWSRTTYLVRGGLKLAAAAGQVVARRSIPSSPTADVTAADFPGYRRLLWYACKSRDRYLTYRTARRAANQGWIVVSDRYPHPLLRLMEGPQIKRLTEERRGQRIVGALVRAEHHYHRMVAPPELAFVLRLHPEEAARRKTNEPSDYVVKRSSEVWDIDWSDSSVHVIDASQAPEAVVAELKALIWSSLA